MKANRWLIAAVVILAAALAVETVYLYRTQAGKKDPGVRPASERTAPEAYAPPVSARRVVFRGDPSFRTAAEEWDPFDEMDRIQARMNQLFRDSFQRSFAGGGFADREWVYEPEVDVRETADAYTLYLDLPGVDKGAINVKVQDRVLTVSGERRHDTEQADPRTGVIRSESSFSSFRRSFPLPPDADTDSLRAESRDGVLTVTLSKRQDHAAPEERKIPVQ